MGFAAELRRDGDSGMGGAEEPKQAMAVGYCVRTAPGEAAHGRLEATPQYRNARVPGVTEE